MYISDNDSFSVKLRRLRLGRTPHLSQERVARNLGVSRDTYANYESGRNTAPFWFACAAASYFGVPLDELTDEEQERNHPK